MPDDTPRTFEQWLKAYQYDREWSVQAFMRDAWDAGAAAERERCAKVVEPFATNPHGLGATYWGEGLAAAIRRGPAPGDAAVSPPAG